ncbi:LytR/AlgR family response regulator transcription factor [Flavihumibacter stibioxidans]|uniref:DNA-binding response regulator n=1 Tax=Flavihumibacter stibioxidans TaxID=1834163 RepID=A0ABR7M6W0_9BACT|nr:LytTR family DNA-binding domain-containing protein [Flavihumibacter stibioxidans]MBC6490358.1 hypothetical protein [Flavihumibacter stibioxidans]
MKLLIVEDEKLLAGQLTNMVMRIDPAAEVVARTNSIRSTVQWLRSNAMPDLILMDIELADGQCFEIFNQVPVSTPVIFTTAYDEYTLKAFKVNSIDYLLKPVKEDELNAAINKFKTLHYTSAVPDTSGQINLLLSQLGKNQSAGFRERFLIRQGQKMISVNTDQVAFFLASNKLNFIITKEKQKFMIDHTLEEVEHMVDPKKFFRANRQLILSQDVVKAIYPWFKGKLKVDVSVPAEEDVLISREKATAFKEWMGG